MLLILFHVFVLLVPFINNNKHLVINFSCRQIQYLQTTSNSISNVTVALVLMFLIIEGQRSIRAMIAKQRTQTYAQTENQILKWFEITKPQAFDFDANLINSEPAQYQDILRNFKVEGSAKKIINVFHYNNKSSQYAKEYCKNVHFEITCYPSEIIYGIHIEFDDYQLSQKIHTALEQILNLRRQSKEFTKDDIIPKKPGWLFITKTIHLEGDDDKDFLKILTHARHFVELVGHSYDLLYSKKLIDIYINYKSKI